MRTWKHGWAALAFCARAAFFAATLLVLPPLFGPFVPATEASAQTSAEIRDVQLRHWESSMRRVMALANAMPARIYTWSPGEGVMEVGQVYMHIARYNYLYASENLGIPLPGGVVMDEMEAVRDKADVMTALQASTDWLRDQITAMTPGELAAETELYGRTVPSWAVLVQLETHLSEHLGQSIAYARMNGVVPPWSR
jgi:uncharacterized damage-inducible protein DinB